MLAVGCSLWAAAAALSAMSFDHMMNVCGSNAGHCMACIGAGICLVAALVAGGSGLSLLRRSEVVAWQGRIRVR